MRSLFLTEARLAMIQNSQNRDLIESQALTIRYHKYLFTLFSDFFQDPYIVSFL